MDKRIEKVFELVENLKTKNNSKRFEEIDELSNDLLGRYKKKATDDSRAADAAGNVKKANKRFSGVMKATKKQFANFKQKPVAEDTDVEVEESDDLEEGILRKIADKVMGAAPKEPKYKVGQTVSYVTTIEQPTWDDRGRGKGKITKYSNGHYIVNGKPINHFEIKKLHEKTLAPIELKKPVAEDTDGKDTVTLEIPALMRALEWAREDAKDDVEIHKFVEKLINHEGNVDMEFFSEAEGKSKRLTFAGLDALPDHPIERHTSSFQGANVGEYTAMFPSSKSARRFAKYVEHKGGKVRLYSRGRDTYVYHKGAGPLVYKDMLRDVDVGFFSEGVVPSADHKIEESHFPQEAVGKSNKKIAEILKNDLQRVGVKLKTPDPFPGKKGIIWSVESNQYPDQVVALVWTARASSGRSLNKDKDINLSFELFNEDGTRFEPTKMNKLNSIASITFDGIGKIYKERVA